MSGGISITLLYLYCGFGVVTHVKASWDLFVILIEYYELFLDIYIYCDFIIKFFVIYVYYILIKLCFVSYK